MLLVSASTLPTSAAVTSVSFWAYDQYAENSPYYTHYGIVGPNVVMAAIDLMDRGWGFNSSGTSSYHVTVGTPTVQNVVARPLRSVGWHQFEYTLDDAADLLEIRMNGDLLITTSTTETLDIFYFNLHNYYGGTQAAVIDDFEVTRDGVSVYQQGFESPTLPAGWFGLHFDPGTYIAPGDSTTVRSGAGSMALGTSTMGDLYIGVAFDLSVLAPSAVPEPTTGILSVVFVGYVVSRRSRRSHLSSRLAPTTLILTCLLAQFPRAASGTTIFTDRTSFDSATAAFERKTNDFDSIVGTDVPANYPYGVGYETGSPQGITVDGVNFLGRGPFENWETYILRDDNDGGHYDLDDNIDGNFVVLVGRQYGQISFDQGVHAFGFDYRLSRGVGDYPVPGSLKATIYFDGGETSDYVMDTVDGALFFGVYSAASIERISFNNTVPLVQNPTWSPYLLVDNMTLASVSAAPEPTSCLASCTVVGFAFGIVGRRRRVCHPLSQQHRLTGRGKAAESTDSSSPSLPPAIIPLDTSATAGQPERE